MKTVALMLMMIPVLTYGQEYIAEAPLADVKVDGFYLIKLPPEITDIRNVRMIDSSGTEVPFMELMDPPDYNSFRWTYMKFDQQIKTGCCTVITINNEKKEYIDHFLIKARNTNINKSGMLRGSDDGEIWYSVMENFPLEFNSNIDKTSRLLEIPLSMYKYYRLTLDDSTSKPLDIVSIERTHDDIIHSLYIEIPNVSISSFDSLQDRETWGVIEFDTAQYVDRIEFDVYGPHLYKRRAMLLNSRFEVLQSFDIISGQARALSASLKEKKLFIRVDNDNNPPLKFTQVAAYQRKRLLITYLEAMKDYRLVLGNNLERSAGGIKFLRDTIPSHPAELAIGKFEKRIASSKTTNRNAILTAIIVGMIILSYSLRNIIIRRSH